MRTRFAIDPPRSSTGAAGLVLLGAFLVQTAATMALGAFHRIGPASTSAWRFLFGSLVLCAVVRPRVRRFTAAQWRAAIIFGVATALMNQSFYQAIDRIHLGSAVAIEYLGPFTLAVLGRRTWRHGLFALVAVGGIVALTRPGSGITWVGALFAMGAGAGWATYALTSHRVGRATEGFDGLAVAMSIAALGTLPFVFTSGSRVLASGSLAVRLLAMAVLAVVLGFGSELQALRRLTPSIVGVLLALNPAVAFFVGWLFLHQRVQAWDLVGLVLVVAAGIAVTRDSAVVVVPAM